MTFLRKRARLRIEGGFLKEIDHLFHPKHSNNYHKYHLRQAQCVASSSCRRCCIEMGHPAEFPKLRKRYVSNNHHVLFPFDVSPRQWTKNINSLCKKLEHPSLLCIEWQWCRFRLGKIQQKKKNSTTNVERTAKKWKSEKCYVLENQSVANSCTKRNWKCCYKDL